MTVPPEITAVVFPDVEQMVVDHVVETTQYYACTVKPEGDDFTESLPVVQITRIGGVRTTGNWSGRRLRDEPRLVVDVWGSSRPEVNDAVQVVRAAIEQMAGTTRDNGFVLRSWEEVGPAVVPQEPNSNVTHAVMTVGLQVRPA